MASQYYYKMIIAYDGTAYHGWQEQAGLPTIVGALRETFSEIFGMPASILGASRTDAGVHALGQVALLKTALAIDPSRLRFAWNNRLPGAINIRAIEQVSENYSPFEFVRQKTYYYHFFLEKPLPQVARHGWYFRRPVDFQKLNQALHVFVGTHDFRSFITGDDCGDDTIRTVDSIEVVPVAAMGGYRIIVRGPKFLRHMIRRLCGAALYVASRPDVPIEYLHAVLAEKNPEQTLPNAPALGLLLYTIRYDESDSSMKETQNEQTIYFD